MTYSAQTAAEEPHLHTHKTHTSHIKTTEATLILLQNQAPAAALEAVLIALSGNMLSQEPPSVFISFTLPRSLTVSSGQRNSLSFSSLSLHKEGFYRGTKSAEASAFPKLLSAPGWTPSLINWLHCPRGSRASKGKVLTWREKVFGKRGEGMAFILSDALSYCLY